MADEKRKKNRSPNYPAISLKTAIGYLDKLYDYANGMHPVPMLTAIEKAWKMKAGSSHGKQIVAALISYGLADHKGSGDKRQIFITPIGGKIHANHTDRESLIKDAAIKPTIHRELWDRYKENGLPPDDTIKQYLVWDREGNKFNRATVDSFIGAFRETVEFANLQSGDIMEGDEGSSDHGNDSDGGGQQQKDGGRTPDTKSRRMKPKEGQQEAVFPLDEGEAVLQWPTHLNADSFEDFKNWVNLIVNKVKRSVDSESNNSKAADDLLS